MCGDKYCVELEKKETRMLLTFMIWHYRWTGNDGVKEQEGRQKEEQGG